MKINVTLIKKLSRHHYTSHVHTKLKRQTEEPMVHDFEKLGANSTYFKY